MTAGRRARWVPSSLCGLVVIASGAGSLAGCSGGSAASRPAPPATRSGPSATTASVTPTAPTSRSGAAPSSVSGPGSLLPALSDGPTGPAHDVTSSPAQVARPVRVRIPAIGVDSSLQTLGLTRSGELQTPSKWQQAGWYGDGVRPGDIGPAVIAGHIDSVSGPAVFYRLRELHSGDRVYVSRADGSTVTFTVSTIAQYPKSRFPTEAVYGPTSEPVLRLVTCTGVFDARHHNYLDNLVVTAVL